MPELESRRGSKSGSVGVTGTPGTGKKTVAPIVAESLGLQPRSLNEMAAKLKLVAPRSGGVDTEILRRRLARGPSGPCVYYGHLLPYVLDGGRLRRVIVLRCEPGVLKGRLLARGYPPRKVTENVESELIGVVSSDAFDAFGASKTFEVDTTRASPEAAAATAVAVLGGKEPPGRIDWTTGYDSGAKLRLLLSAEA